MNKKIELSNIVKNMDKVGVDILRQDGTYKSLGSITDDLADIWGSLDKRQKQSLSIMIAGR